MTYLFAGCGILVTILAVLLHLANNRLDEANQALGLSMANTAVAIEANKTVRETLDVCIEVNAANADQRDAAVSRAEKAEARISVMAGILQESINDFDTTEFRDNTECHTLSDPLPAVFLNRLCIQSANCIDAN